MTGATYNSQSPISAAKSDSVTDLLASVEKIKMSKSEIQISFLFNKITPATNLRERFLFATFEIIGENGADALSASELIKRTKSSKGALFHHFDTIDQLCIESLKFFKAQMIAGLPKEKFSSLEGFLKWFVTDSTKKQGTRYYVHLVNFFRDRAIRDERYREPLKEIFEVNLNYFTDQIAQFLPATVSRETIFARVLFAAMTVERVSFHRVLYQNPEACQSELDSFLKDTLAYFQSLA